MQEEVKQEVNRTRKRQMILRLTEDEFELIERKYNQSRRKNRSDFLLDCISGKPMVVIDPKVLADILMELSRQGNNLNQIARALNEGLQVHEIQETAAQCRVVYARLFNLAKGAVNADI